MNALNVPVRPRYVSKSTWAQCDALRVSLYNTLNYDCTTRLIYDKWKEIKKHYPVAMSGDVKELTTVMGILEQGTVVAPEIKLHKSKKVVKTGLDAIDNIKPMAWAIKAIGDIEVAKKTFDFLYESVKRGDL